MGIIQLHDAPQSTTCTYFDSNVAPRQYFFENPGLVRFVTTQMYKLIFSPWAFGAINRIPRFQYFGLYQSITHLAPSRTYLLSVINRSHGQ